LCEYVDRINVWIVWIGLIGIILLKSTSVELCRFTYSLGEPPRWANKLICIIMQNTDLQNYADLQTRWASNTHWANFQVRKFQTLTSGWASATSWASIGQWLGEWYSLGEFPGGNSIPVLVVGLMLLAGRASTSGWASDTSRASKYEIKTCILE